MQTISAWTPTALAWLEEALPGAGSVEVEPLVAGHSNIVLALRRGEDRYILRRPPFGSFAATAHDVLREARLLRVLAEIGSPRTARVIVTVEAPPVGPAYVMARLPGVAIRGVCPDWLDTPDKRTTLSIDLVRTLVELHTLPVEPLEAAQLGRAGGYLERQVRRWSGQRDELRAAGARELPDELPVRAWLAANLPAEGPSTLVHGDFKLDNVLIDPVTALVTGVLDLEMATVGDPLSDVGFLLAFWPDSAEAAAVFAELLGEVTLAPGFLDHAGLVATYAGFTGRKLGLEDLRWYQVLAIWKMALLLEASYGRWLAGTTDDEFFACLDTAVPRLLAAARRLTREP